MSSEYLSDAQIEHRRRLAYTAGRKAALAEKSRDKNNRQRGTIFYDDWADGWDEGHHERKRAFS